MCVTHSARRRRLAGLAPTCDYCSMCTTRCDCRHVLTDEACYNAGKKLASTSEAVPQPPMLTISPASDKTTCTCHLIPRGITAKVLQGDSTAAAAAWSAEFSCSGAPCATTSGKLCSRSSNSVSSTTRCRCAHHESLTPSSAAAFCHFVVNSECLTVSAAAAS